jgi:Tol biopolymer transport system component
VISAGGGEPEQVTSGNEDHWDATWSPDGNSLAYATVPDDPSSTRPLYIVNLKTRQATVVPNSARLGSPRWSPDGRYLLATDDSRIMLYDFNLHSWQQLNQGKVEASYPVWTPEGKCVYFHAISERGSPEDRICLSDRKIQHVADMARAGNLAPIEVGDDWWTGLAPDGSILGLRDASSEEIYALDVKFP